MRPLRGRPLLGLACLLLAAGCSGDAGVASLLVVATVEVSPPAGSVVLGRTLNLTATPKTEGGLPLPGHDVVWSSTDINTATVTPDGVVTGQAVGGPVRIRAAVEGVTGETQITVVPVPVDHVIVTPPTNSIVVAQQIQLTATAYDASNVVLTGRTFTWSSPAPSVAAVTTTGLVLGIGPGGPVLVTATADGKSASATVAVGQRPAARLGFLQQFSAAVAGQVLAPPIRVAVQDDLGGTVVGATNSVTIALAGNPGGATLGGTRTAAAVNGIATFANLTLDRASNGYTLMATATGLASAISNAFNVTAGAATQLGFTTAPPATAKSGVAFTASPVVQVRDASGNPVPGAGRQIAVAISSGGATLSGTTTATTNATGAATFAGLTITGPVRSYTLSFSSTGLSALTSSALALTAGTAASIGVTTQPAATAKSGIALAPQPVVRLFDGAGNPVSQAGVLITATVQVGPVGGTLTGTTAIGTSSSGVVTFTNLVLNGTAGTYALRFSGTGLTFASSTPVVLSPGNGSILSLTVQPSAQAASGQAFALQPVIQLRDAAGNLVAKAGVIVGVSIPSGGGTLGGSTTATTNSAGVATFTNLSITGLVGNRTLLFGSSGYVSVASNPVSLTAGSASRLTIIQAPAAQAQNGVVLSQQPVLQLQDAAGNPVSQGGVGVTAAISQGNGTLGGTAIVSTDASGQARFTNLTLTGKLGSYQLAFAAPGLNGVTSTMIALGAGPASQLAITTAPPASVTDGVPFAVQPVIQLQDASGNPVSTAGAAVTASLSGCTNPASAFSAGSVVTIGTSVTGAAAFTNLAISGPGTCSISFTTTAPGVTPATSGPITIN